MTARYENVLFDWDGTLARTLDVWMRAYEGSLAELGLFPSRRAIGGQFGDWHGVLGLGVRQDQYDAWLEDLKCRVTDGMSSVALYDGARAMLTDVRATGARTALITTSTRDLLRPVLERTGTAELFDTVVTAEDVSRHKPDPEPVLEALRRLGGSPDRAVMVGDSDKDLGAARNAGVASILMFPPDHAAYYDIEVLRSFGPAHVCGSFAELYAVLAA